MIDGFFFLCFKWILSGFLWLILLPVVRLKSQKCDSETLSTKDYMTVFPLLLGPQKWGFSIFNSCCTHKNNHFITLADISISPRWKGASSSICEGHPPESLLRFHCINGFFSLITSQAISSSIKVSKARNLSLIVLHNTMTIFYFCPSLLTNKTLCIV